MNSSIDLKKIAKKVVQECLLVKPGENFWITCADFYYFNFAEEVAIAAIEAGAYPFITCSTDRIAVSAYKNSEEYLKAPPVFTPRIIEIADVQLEIGFPRDPACLKKIPPDKIAARAIGAMPLKEALLKRNPGPARLRNSSFLYPTPEAAKRTGLTFEEYSDLIWSSIDIDYEALSTRAKKIAYLLRSADKVHIKTDEGSDLTFSIKDRSIFIDDGIMDEEDIQTNTFLQNLPTGEVYVPPLEDSAEGLAVFQYNIFMGEPLINFRAVFNKGKIVEMSADHGLEHYRNIMEKNSGAKYNIAELGIGLNPMVKRVIGELALDEKIIGTIHIATGENRMFGGKNESSIHWDLVMNKPTLEVDGIIIMERGEYKV